MGNSQTRPDHGVQWAELEQTPRHRPINFANIEILGRRAVLLLLHLGDLDNNIKMSELISSSFPH